MARGRARRARVRHGARHARGLRSAGPPRRRSACAAVRTPERTCCSTGSCARPCRRSCASRGDCGSRVPGTFPRGASIVVVNHDSMADPFVVGAAIDRPLRYLAKSELWRNPLIRRAIESLGAIPVTRERGDVAAVEAAARAVDAGDIVVIFPQGTVLGGPDRPWQRGAARLALTTGAPLVPVAIVGAANGLRPGTWLPRPRARAGRDRRADPRRGGSRDDPGSARADRTRAREPSSAGGAPRLTTPAQAHSTRAGTSLRLIRGERRAAVAPVRSCGAEGEPAADHRALQALQARGSGSSRGLIVISAGLGVVPAFLLREVLDIAIQVDTSTGAGDGRDGRS